jgi:hypothetical protein
MSDLAVGTPSSAKQRNELRVGALVEHQKAGIHPVGDHPLCGGQRHIHRVGMAAKVATRFEQRDLRMACQFVRGCQTRNTGTDDCDA